MAELPLPILLIDTALRGGMAAVLLLYAAVLLRDAPRSVTARLGAFFCLGVAAYVVEFMAGVQALRPSGWHAPMLALSAGNAVVFWLFAGTLFDDDFQPRGWHGALWAVFAFAGIANCLLPVRLDGSGAGPAAMLIWAGNLVFGTLALVQAASTWRADLVESRRRLRIFIVAGGAIYMVVSTSGRLLAQTSHANASVALADALVLAAIVLLAGWWLLRVAPEELFPERAAPEAQPQVRERSESAALEPALPPAGPVPVDPALAAALDHQMTVECVYREEGLTLGDLAARLQVPEHRLRRHINQGLGHRNFNAFLNAYRIGDARRALADPAYDAVPVLTIAMDAGFQSIGPFNRAFKALTGVTPTEYRRRTGQGAELPAMRLADSEIG